LAGGGLSRQHRDLRDSERKLSVLLVAGRKESASTGTLVSTRKAFLL
jgi:hypothetical protein